MLTIPTCPLRSIRATSKTETETRSRPCRTERSPWRTLPFEYGRRFAGPAWAAGGSDESCPTLQHVRLALVSASLPGMRRTESPVLLPGRFHADHDHTPAPRFGSLVDSLRRTMRSTQCSPVMAACVMEGAACASRRMWTGGVPVDGHTPSLA